MSEFTVSAVFAPSTRTPEHIALAERLGYERAWCFDSPALYADVWMVLARAAAITDRIGLGPGVLVPSLRHPMVTASAIASLEAWAPGRVSVALGAGLTGRMAMGQKPMRWAEVDDHVRVVRSLLAGEVCEWEGEPIALLQGPNFGATRPIDVPIIVGADGPKGFAVAERHADGVVSPVSGRVGSATQFAHRIVLTWGTVLDDGETLVDQRVVDATEPGLAVMYHLALLNGPEAIDALPGGDRFRVAAGSVDPRSLHLALHEGHFVVPNALDGFPPEAFETLLPKVSLTGDRARVRERLERFAGHGVTEVAYQPIGPDIERELEAFAEVALG